MRVPRLRLAAVALIGGIALSGCAYDMYGDPYGYGSVGVGIGYGGYGSYGGYYGDPYYGYGGYGPYGGYGYGYGGYDPFGWYGDYYYPGVGIYVYDRDRHRYRWNDQQRRYWSGRTSNWQSRTGTTYRRENWSGWNRGSTTTTNGSTSGTRWHRHDGRQ
jgi:hypothetical protein